MAFAKFKLDKLRGLCPPSGVGKVVLVGGAVIVTGAVVSYAAYNCVKWWFPGIGQSGPYNEECFRHVPNRILARLTTEDVAQQMDVLELVEPYEERQGENGHKVSGAVRDAARRTMERVVQASGKKRYDISPTSYNAPEVDSWHVHVAPNDLWKEIGKDEITDQHIVTMVDVDYYIESRGKFSELGSKNSPILLYTFAPTTVSGVDGDNRFRLQGNEVCYEVSGGTAWKHKLWDWTRFGEFLSFREGLKWSMDIRVGGHTLRIPNVFALAQFILGLRKEHIYKVCYARPWPQAVHRALVWLLPQYERWQATFLPQELRVRQLERFDFRMKEGWNGIVSLEGGELNISIGREGEDAHVELSKEHFDVLMALESPQSVTTRLLSYGYAHNDPTLAMVGQYYRGALPGEGPKVRLGRPAAKEKVVVHWPYTAMYEMPEPAFRSISPALVENPAMVPNIRRWEALSATIDRRVTDQMNHRIPCKFVRTKVAEFLKQLVPRRGVGEPMELESVLAELTKPTQVTAIKKILETMDMQPRALIEAFVKNEPGMKTNRLISSFPDARFLVQFSAYSLAFREAVLHAEYNSHWFDPGKTPTIIAQGVQDYVATVPEVLECDYSNFDGSISAYMQREVMNAAYMRWFRDPSGVKPYLDKLITCPAVAKRFGFRYEAGPGVKSGSVTTCDLNTVMNGAMQYVAIRKARPDIKPVEAYRLIGPTFGDDSLFDATYRGAINWVAEQFGMKLKAEVCGEQGVSYLGRVYPDPWLTTSSFQDPLRTLRKLHLTGRNRTVPLEHAALDRVEGYLQMDALTPIVGAYCRLVQRSYAQKDSEAREKRADRDFDKPYWLVTGESWPQDPADVPKFLSCMAARFGVEEEKVVTYDEFLERCETVDDILPLEMALYDKWPYAATVAPDGLPADVEVDPRKLQEDAARQSERAAGGSSGTATQPGVDDASRSAGKLQGDGSGSGLVRGHTSAASGQSGAERDPAGAPSIHAGNDSGLEHGPQDSSRSSGEDNEHGERHQPQARLGRGDGRSDVRGANTTQAGVRSNRGRGSKQTAQIHQRAGPPSGRGGDSRNSTPRGGRGGHRGGSGRGGRSRL
jgi:hypothetical protein